MSLWFYYTVQSYDKVYLICIVPGDSSDEQSSLEFRKVEETSSLQAKDTFVVQLQFEKSNTQRI